MTEDTKNKIKKNWNEFKHDAIECINEAKNKKTRKKQIPNMLTASRLLAPLFIIPSALCGNLVLTLLFTSLFGLTDAFDGYIARKYNTTSEFGRKLDPITDKVFATSLLIPLTIYNPLMILTLGCEAIIASINVNMQLNNKRPKTVKIGKIKTWSLFITIALSYINFAIKINPNIINSFIGITSLLQILSIKDYKKCLTEANTEETFEKNIYETSQDIFDDCFEKQKEYNKKHSKKYTERIRGLKNYRNSIIEANENSHETNSIEEVGKQFQIKK